ncbi:MAG: hypothetical protein L3J95_03095 [Thermoplasmata archaeon]|nr:hypothetical protein [Thermoplasmata archaeon]
MVPSALGRRVLLYEFVVLAEYWLAPTLLGVTNYAGIWSDVGVLLFVLFVGSLAWFVLRPLRPHLKRALRSRESRLAFHGVWAAALAAALFVTNVFQISRPSAIGSSVQLGDTTVYSPFGAWPSLTVYLPRIGLFGTFDVEVLTVLGLISVLGSAALRLAIDRRSTTCPAVPTRPWTTRVATVAVWSPLGLITGCTACAPAYLAILGLVAPAASTGLASVPLVPWIGLAGLLYLGSFGLAIHLIRRATGPAPESVGNPEP